MLMRSEVGWIIEFMDRIQNGNPKRVYFVLLVQCTVRQQVSIKGSDTTKNSFFNDAFYATGDFAQDFALDFALDLALVNTKKRH